MIRPQFEIMGTFRFSDPQRLMIIEVQESNYLESQQKKKKKWLKDYLKTSSYYFPVNPEVEKVLDLLKI